MYRINARSTRSRGLRRLGLVPLALAVAACGSTVDLGQVAGQGQSLGGQLGTSGDGLSIDPGGQSPEAIATGSPTDSPSGTAGSTNEPVAGESSSPGSQPTSDAGTGTPSSSGTAAGPRGSGIGVYKDKIYVGVVTVQSFSNVAAAAGLTAETGNQKNKVNAVIALINAQGGIAGRKLIPVFYDVNVTRLLANKAAEQEAICSKFTQDNKVFAVASPVGFTDDVLYKCLTKAGVATASAGESFDQQFYSQFPDSFYMPGDMNMTRILSTNIDALYDAKYFTGWDVTNSKAGKAPVKIGLVRKDTPSDKRVTTEGVKPALARHGLTLSGEVAIPITADSSTAYRGAVLQFKAQGITHVLFTSVAVSTWMSTSQDQGYHPRYGLNSRVSPGALLESSSSRAQMLGSMGIGWQQYNDVTAANDPGPASARGKDCLNAMTKAGEDNSIRPSALISTWYCDTLYFLADATSKAPDFALKGLRAGAEALGLFGAASTFRSYYKPGRLHDGAGAYRLVSYVESCSCYRYTTALRTIS